MKTVKNALIAAVSAIIVATITIIPPILSVKKERAGNLNPKSVVITDWNLPEYSNAREIIREVLEETTSAAQRDNLHKQYQNLTDQGYGSFESLVRVYLTESRDGTFALLKFGERRTKEFFNNTYPTGQWK